MNSTISIDIQGACKSGHVLWQRQAYFNALAPGNVDVNLNLKFPNILQLIFRAYASKIIRRCMQMDPIDELST